MKPFSLIFSVVLFIGTLQGNTQIENQKEPPHMDVQTLTSILNFSKTLIQDAEIKFLWYLKYPTHSENVGKVQQEILAFREQEFREAHKDSNPPALRKIISKRIENLKKYGSFRDTDENFLFKEIDLIFQVLPDSTLHDYRINYRMEYIDRFENFPSLDFKRYFDGGSQQFRFTSSNQDVSGHYPSQFAKDQRIGAVEIYTDANDAWETSFPCLLPPALIDKEKASVEPAVGYGENVYVITHSPFKTVRAKVYVRVTEVPEVFREEHYYQSESPNADEDDYWLRTVAEYADFVRLEKLGIAYPKIAKEKEYRPDGFLMRIEIITIKEMAFNQGLPPNFFDFNPEELEIEGIEKQ